MDSEKLLPLDQRIDPLLAQCGDEIRSELQAKQLGDKEILDPSIELAEYENFEAFSQFIENEVLHVQDFETQQAVYRAMTFAYEAAWIVHEENAQYNAMPYIRHIMQSEDREKQLRQDTEYYLADNPHIHELIQYYLDDIDQGREKSEMIEVSAALIFMLVERNLGDIWVHESSQNLSSDMFEREEG